ncbi:MAG: NAD-dependent succinate-semialdehyde dehydrogenase [Chitinophagaceae bacterium]|nr:MAG: NAD-dependent succinate-semialdehyde dehydrogenase [Chitinophagaceae bacterium]
MKYISLNPATEIVMSTYATHNEKHIMSVLNKSDEAQKQWKILVPSVRVKYVESLIQLLEERQDEFAGLITSEMGKPIVDSKAEISKCITLCKYYQEKLKWLLKEEVISTSATMSYVAFEPLGIILEIMPWNFPFWQVFRNAVPAILSGNSVLLKHAPNVPQCAISIEKLFHDAGFPEGLFQSLFLNNKQAAGLIADKRVQMVCLTGSSKAGSEVASIAGKHLKKQLLELGGSDPMIITEKANISKAVEIAIKSRLMNAGQSCIASKRFIISKAVEKAFKEAILDKVQSIKIGDPQLEETQMGPMARNDLRKLFLKQIALSQKKGANLLYGGNKIGKKGFFVEPVVLSNIAPGMPAFDEEVFGPAISFMTYKDEKEAVFLANNTVYGLGASVWTEDEDEAKRYIRSIESGNVFVNSLVKSDVRLPFGGIKNSGYGRELSHYGIKEFCNIKSVWID